MRRRRRTKYTWLPTLNGRTFSEDQAIDATFQVFQFDVPENGNLITGVVPVICDTPQSIIVDQSEGIGEIIGNEYLLKRIVGKCFCSFSWQNLTGGDVAVEELENAAIMVKCGFFVARADPLNYAEAVAGLAEQNALYSPLSNELNRQPWIWQRTWILGAGGFGPGLTEDAGTTLPNTYLFRGRGAWPATNASFSGVLDGPHIDAKTARRVRQEERLFFAMSTSRVSGTNLDNTKAILEVVLDARYLGAIRKARNRSAF